jgi:hypothetical protein
MDLDLSRVKARHYRSQWRFIIDCPYYIRNKAHYYSHYMCVTRDGRPSRWSRFITPIMATKLSRDEIREVLPLIREILPISTKLIDIHSFLVQYNPSLARSLIDVSIVFDSSPHDLKSHIVACFGVQPEELEEFVEARRRERRRVPA